MTLSPAGSEPVLRAEDRRKAFDDAVYRFGTAPAQSLGCACRPDRPPLGPLLSPQTGQTG